MNIEAYLNPANSIYTPAIRKAISICDGFMIFSICLLTYFLPMSNAIISVSFGIMFLAFLIKRTIVLIFLSKDQSRSFNFVRDFVQVFQLNFGGYGIYILAIGGVIFLSIALNGFYSAGFQKLFTRYFREILLFSVFIEVINSRKRFLIFILTFLAIFTLVSTDAVSQIFLKASFIYPDHIAFDRVTSAFAHSNDLGTYLASFLPFLVAILFGGFMFKKEGEWFNNLKAGNFSLNLHWVSILIFILAFIGLGHTLSRAAWLGFMVAFFLILIIQKKWLGLWIFLGIMFIFVALFLNAFILGRPEVFHGATNFIGAFFNMESRVRYWNTAFVVIDFNPFFGIGYGEYIKTLKSYQLFPVEYPHNCYLHIAAETGLVGLATYLALFGAFFTKQLRALSNVVNKFSKLAMVGLLSGLASFLIVSFFDTAFSSIRLSTLMWLLMATAVALQRIENKET